MKSHIIQDVERIVKEYNTRNPFALCEHLDINLFHHNLGDILKGYYLFNNSQHNIVINTNICIDEQRIVLGHELGHAVEHSALSCAFTESRVGVNINKLETEANLFCAELLIPDEEILSLISYEYSFYSICEELCFPDWLLDYKIQMLINKGYSNFRYLYLANKDSIKM